ncbi:30S ribosomal protein S8e [uncultured archaeon]|nr:30S ribosomal protein S8e [uncultured archaeon]
MNKGKQITGGKYIKNRKKKKYELPGQKKIVKVSETDKERRKTKRVAGGNKKTFLLQAKFINVTLKDKKIKKAQVKNVLETPSDRFLARQNIITKGTILETELGKVKVTNRPTQEGTLNGILAE